MAQLQAANIGKNLKANVSQATVITTNARAIIAQKDVVVKQIPHLPEHQKKARAHAKKWLDSIWPQIIDTTSSIIDFANTFDSAQQNMLELTKRLEKGDEQAKKEFLAVLNEVLLKSLQQKLESSSKIASNVGSFHDEFQTDYEAFHSDFIEADKVITGDNVELKQKKARRDDALATAKKLQIAIQVDAAAMPVTAEVTLALSETGVGLLIGGLIFLVEGGALIGMKIAYANAMDEVNSLTQEINQLNKEINSLKAVEHQISGLQDASKKIVVAAADVADSWRTLASEMGQLIKRVDSISPEQVAIVIKTELAAANKDWQVVLKLALKLQPSDGQIPHKTFKSMDAYVKALKAKPRG